MSNNLVYTHEYHGFSLPPENAPFIEQHLADAMVTINGAMKYERWIVVACVDLRLPDFTGFIREPCTNHLAIKFVKKMQHYSRWKHTDLHDGVRQEIRPNVDAIWQKAYASSGVPYYKIMLLLNSEAYNSQATEYDPGNTVQFRAQLAWAKVMGIPQHSSDAYIRFPVNGMMSVENNADGLCKLFAKASALCTVPSDANCRAFVMFGSTRKASKYRAAI